MHTDGGEAGVKVGLLSLAAQEVVALAVSVLCAADREWLRVPGAACLVEGANLRSGREQREKVWVGAALSALEDDLGRHVLVDVAEVEYLNGRARHTVVRMGCCAATWNSYRRTVLTSVFDTLSVT